MSTIEQAVEDLLNEQDWTGKIFSDGWVDAPETIETIEPATGDVLGIAGVANAASVAAAAKSAARAQRDWAATPMAERVAIMRRAGEILERHRGEIIGWMVRESGCDPAEGRASRSTASIGQLDEAASDLGIRSSRCSTSRSAGADLDRAARADRRRRRDHAVELPDRARDALARAGTRAGQRGRAQERSEHTGHRRRDHRAHLRGGRTARGRAARPLRRRRGRAGARRGPARPDDLVHRLDATGRLVGEAAGRTLKRAVLELGGNSPLIVLDDADIEAASSAGAWGSFLHQGQICLAVSRHLVHESIVEEYLVALTERAGHLPVGDPASGEVAIGPIINEKQIAARAANRRRDGRSGRDGRSSAEPATERSSRRRCCVT